MTGHASGDGWPIMVASPPDSRDTGRSGAYSSHTGCLGRLLQKRQRQYPPGAHGSLDAARTCASGRHARREATPPIEARSPRAVTDTLTRPPTPAVASLTEGGP